MFFKQLAAKDSALSYFFGCASLGKAVAVDVVAGDEGWFIEQASSAKAEITHVFDTHIHADHYSGGRKLAAMTGAAYCLHESTQGLVKFPFTPLHDGQTIEVGNTILKVMHTPGHTTDGMALVVTDKSLAAHGTGPRGAQCKRTQRVRKSCKVASVTAVVKTARRWPLLGGLLGGFG